MLVPPCRHTNVIRRFFERKVYETIDRSRFVSCVLITACTALFPTRLVCLSLHRRTIGYMRMSQPLGKQGDIMALGWTRTA